MKISKTILTFVLGLLCIGMTQLHAAEPPSLREALDRDDIDTFKLLIGQRPDVNEVFRNKISLLMLAALKPNTDFAKTLIEAKASVDPADEFGETVFDYATYDKTEEDALEMLEALMTAHPDSYLLSLAIANAALRGHLSIVKLLLDNGANPSEYTSKQEINALKAAASRGHEEIVAILLENRANTDGAAAIAEANGHPQIAQMINESSKYTGRIKKTDV